MKTKNLLVLLFGIGVCVLLFAADVPMIQVGSVCRPMTSNEVAAIRANAPKPLYLDAATMFLANEYCDVLAVWGCNETNSIEVNAAIIITNPTNSPSQKIDAQADLLGKRILLREAGYSFDGTSNKVTEVAQ
jgi:hypothetical protein